MGSKGNIKQYSIRLSSIPEIILFLLTSIKEQLGNGHFDQLLRIFSFYFMDQSFLADNVFLTDELYRMKVNTEHSELVLDRQQEKELIMNYFISKMTCFTFLASTKKGTSLLRRNSKENRGNGGKQFSRILFLSGIYLFKKCSEVNSNYDHD